MGVFGYCQDMDGKEFDYWIADLYTPWTELPAGFETAVIPGGLWAEFRCHGALPDSLQSVNTQIWSEWLPSLKGYSPGGNYSMEVYGPLTENPDDYECFIWIPLKKES